MSRFGELCSFGARCKVEYNYTLIKMLKVEGIGSRKDCTYFFICEEGMIVRCGCKLFEGFDAFEKAVQGTHKENQQYLKEYMGAISYIKSITD